MPQAGINDESFYTGDPGDEQQVITASSGSGASNGAEEAGNTPSSNGGDSPDPNAPVAESGEKESTGIKIKASRKPVEPTNAEKEEAIAGYIAMAQKEDIPAYNALELKKKFPKSYKAVVDFANQRSGGLTLDEDTIIGAFLYSPRTILFNFFDRNKLFVNILGYDNRWYYTIERVKQGPDFKTRTEAEVAAFMETFAELEKTLK